MGGGAQLADLVRVRIDRTNLGWWLLGVALLLVVASTLNRYLGWVVFGLFVYYVARPISRRIETAIGRPSLAAALTLALIVVPIVLVLVALAITAIQQLVVIAPPEAVQRFVDTHLTGSQLDLRNPEQVYAVVTNVLEDPSVMALVNSVGTTVGSLAATLFNAFLALLFAFFMLSEDRRIFAWFRTRVFGDDSRALSYFRGVDAGLNSVYFGYTLTIFVIVVVTTLIYNLSNLLAPAGLTIPATVLLGILTGIFTLIPLVGRSVVYAAIVAILAVQAIEIDPTLLWYPVVLFLGLVLVFDNLVRTYIRPYLSGRLYHMGLVMFAYLLGPPLFGWYGIFLGPLVLVLVVTFMDRVLPPLLRGEAAEPVANHEISEYVERPGEEGPAGSEGEPQPG